MPVLQEQKLVMLIVIRRREAGQYSNRARLVDLASREAVGR